MLGVALFVVMGLLGLVSYAIVRDVVYARAKVHGSFFDFRLKDVPQSSGGLPTSTAEVAASGTGVPTLEGTLEPEPTLTPWDGTQRVNVLVMGLDYRDWVENSSASRTDTMILMTLDPVSRTAGMLSIPRDLWVPIPGFKHSKINTAHVLGEAYNLPGGGPGLAVKTVELFLGVPIHYYAIIDFQAFIQFIDELGGLKLDIPYEIEVDPLGDNNTKVLKPGVQTLPGELALAYARNRSTEEGDFDRARRQQQVVLAIRDRILDFELLPTLIQKAPVLYQQLVSGVRTNLGLGRVIRLAVLAQKVQDEDIRQGVIDTSYVAFGRSPDDLSILIPYPDKIRVLRDEIFFTSGSLGPLAPGNDQERMVLEGARILIQNGTGMEGLADRTADYLTAQGANIVAVGAADQGYLNTTVIDYIGRPYTLKYLVSLLSIQERQIEYEFDPSREVDIQLILGQDWVSNDILP